MSSSVARSRFLACSCDIQSVECRCVLASIFEFGANIGAKRYFSFSPKLSRLQALPPGAFIMGSRSGSRDRRASLGSLRRRERDASNPFAQIFAPRKVSQSERDAARELSAPRPSSLAAVEPSLLLSGALDAVMLLRTRCDPFQLPPLSELNCARHYSQCRMLKNQ